MPLVVQRSNAAALSAEPAHTDSELEAGCEQRPLLAALDPEAETAGSMISLGARQKLAALLVCGAAAAAAALTFLRAGAGPPIASKTTVSLDQVAVSVHGRAYQLRAEGTGCQNWRGILVGDVRQMRSVEDCARACNAQHGCVGFGFQTTACDERVRSGGTVHLPEGECALWSGDCEGGANSCWDDYTALLAQATSTTSAPTSTTTVAKAPGNTSTALTAISIDNIDCEKLKDDPDMMSETIQALKEEIAAESGISPDDVDLDPDC